MLNLQNMHPDKILQYYKNCRGKVESDMLKNIIEAAANAKYRHFYQYDERRPELENFEIDDMGSLEVIKFIHKGLTDSSLKGTGRITQGIKNNGRLAYAEKIVKKGPKGMSTFLQDNNLGEYSTEAVVLRHRSLFKPEIIEIAEKTMKEYFYGK
jgi:hypothetical protein